MVPASLADQVPALVPGRTLNCQIMLLYPQDDGTQKEERFTVFCPESPEAMSAEMEPNIYRTDKRYACEWLDAFLGRLLEQVTPTVVSTLQTLGYPPMLDDQGKPMPEGQINGKHPFNRMNTYYGKGEHSAYVVFWYDGVAPIVMDFPPSIVQPSACNVCPRCDPTGENRRKLAALLEEQRQALEGVSGARGK